MHGSANNPESIWANMRENVVEARVGQIFGIVNVEQNLMHWGKWKLDRNSYECKPGDGRNNRAPNQTPNYWLMVSHEREVG